MWPVELKEYLFFVCIEDSLRASTKEEITDLQDEITNMKYGQEAILTILLELKTVFKSRNPYPARVERCSNLGIVMLTQKQNGRDQYRVRPRLRVGTRNRLHEKGCKVEIVKHTSSLFNLGGNRILRVINDFRST